jgi:hypothetical protein
LGNHPNLVSGAGVFLASPNELHRKPVVIHARLNYVIALAEQISLAMTTM